MEENVINQQSIQQRQDNFFRAVMAKDSTYLSAYLHEGFVFISPRAVVLSKPAFIEDFIRNASVQMDIFYAVESLFAVVGTTAVSRGIADAKFRDKDVFKVYYCMTFVLEGTEWKLLAMQETFIP
jgi:hypothetical protein